MKSKIYKLLTTIALVCFSCVFDVYGQSDTVYISKDTTIVFSNIPSNKNVNVYGDVGGQFYITKLTTTNDKVFGVEPKILNPGHKAGVVINFDQLFPDTIVYQYYKAEMRNTGNFNPDGRTPNRDWFAESNPSLKIVIVKIKKESLSVGKSEVFAKDTSVETLEETAVAPPAPGEVNIPWYWIVLCIVSIVFSVICLWLVIGQQKKIKGIDDSILLIKNDRPSSVQTISEERIKEIANNTANDLINSFREGLIHQFNSEQGKSKSLTETSQKQSISPNIVTKEIDTSDVVYNESSNTFTIEPTSISHFRIYSNSNKIYYTINNNILGNEEAVSRWYGNIGTYKSCINCSDNPIAPKKITIIKDGELRQVGAIYEISKPMEISLQ